MPRMLFFLCTCGVVLSALVTCSNQQPDQTITSENFNKSIYVWADTFNTLNNSTIMGVLKQNSIQRVEISYGDKTDKNKLIDFIHLAQASHIRMSLMFGMPTSIFPQNVGKLLSTIDSAMVTTSNLVHDVHLDVEPQSLPDWDTNKVKYLGYYVDMLKQTREHLKDSISLSVSILPTLPVEFLTSVYSYTSKVYCMVYGIKPMSAIAVRLQTALDINKDSTVLSLNAPDFTGKFAMAESTKVLYNLTGIRGIAIQNLKTFITLADGK